MKWGKIKFSTLYAVPSKNGLTRPKAVRGHGYKMINMGELFANDRIWDIPMELVPMTESEKIKNGIEKGDLLFARQSLVLEGAGKCSIVMGVPEYTTFESHLIRVRLNKKMAVPDFYYYYFKSPLSPIKTIVQQCAQAGIRGSDLSEIEVDYPPIEMQSRIAEILSAYDDSIENNQKQIKLLEEAAMRLYKEWFVHFRFPGYENTKIVGGVPEGWRVVPVKDMGEVITGKTPSTIIPDNYGGTVPFIKIPDMHDVIYPLKTETMLSERGANTQKSKFLPPKSIMVSCIATVGLVCITHKRCQTNQQINSIILNDEIDLYFMFFKMKGIKSLLEGVGSNGATMTNVNKTKFENIKLLLPQNEIKEKFNIVVEPIFSCIFAVNQQINELKEARDKLLPKLMSGEIEV